MRRLASAASVVDAVADSLIIVFLQAPHRRVLQRGKGAAGSSCRS
uniref:Uncharacterized protein n=1 Tax=Arundo donax TaxID=35708 RepID=A0A0A9GV56_ARUDO